MKKVYQKVNNLTETQRAYIAGIIDGEGTITLTIKQKGGTRHLAVTVSGTESSLMNYLPKVIGAGRVTSKKVYKLNHSQAYTYSIYSRQAIDLLNQIFPYLLTYKAKRAKLAIEKYVLVTPRNGRYTEQQIIAKENFVSKFLSILPK